MKTHKEIKKKAISIKDYYESEGARELAHAAKKGDVNACIEIAKEVSEKLSIPEGAILVPVPSSKGYATNNLIVCNEINKRTGIEVSNCLKGEKRTPLYDLKKNGTYPSIDYFKFKSSEEHKGKTVIMFDIVIDSATTMNEAKNAIGDKANFIFLSHSMVDMFKDRMLENQNNFEFN